MNLTCTDCGKSFRITADQLGTRGKCPHCRATIILPRAAGHAPVTGEIRAPGLWMERSLSLCATAFLHLLVLSILALVPWRDWTPDRSGEGHAVRIGGATVQSRTTNESPLPQPDVVTADSSRRVIDLFDAQLVSPSTAKSSRNPADESPVAGAGELGEFQEDSLEWFRRRDEGGDDFERLVAELQQDGLEIVITFDSTGSMEGEIGEVKRKIERIGAALFRLVPRTRIGVCTYRDNDARYLVKGLPLTDDIGQIVGFLNEVTAAGGGDDPEAVQSGLKWAIENNEFRERSRKIILLFGDSPPHASDLDDCLLLASEFRRRQGGIVSTVTCHGNQRLPAFIEIARLGGGESFLARNEREIMTQLIVLVFGSEHRDKVIEAFHLMHR